MTKRKLTAPLIHPDKIVARADGVREIWLLWGFEGPGGLFSIGQQPADTRSQVIEQRLAQARGAK